MYPPKDQRRGYSILQDTLFRVTPGVIGIEMILNILEFTDDFGQRGCIEGEQEWAKY